MNFITNILQPFFDIFFPKRCVCCQKYGSFLCFDCAQKIEMVKTDICPECGKISEKARYCPKCRSKSETSLAGIIIAANYDSVPVKEMIHHLKYLGLTEISAMLGELTFSKVAAYFKPEESVIVPVPLHRKKENKRGFNQSRLIAAYLEGRLAMPMADVLIRTRDTKPQVELRRGERLTNVKDSFICQSGAGLEGKTVLLIDDVTTTGATLTECAKVLKEAGAKRIWGVVVARNI